MPTVGIEPRFSIFNKSNMYFTTTPYPPSLGLTVNSIYRVCVAQAKQNVAIENKIK